jgi:hypothetical protein
LDRKVKQPEDRNCAGPFIEVVCTFGSDSNIVNSLRNSNLHLRELEASLNETSLIAEHLPWPTLVPAHHHIPCLEYGILDHSVQAQSNLAVSSLSSPESSSLCKKRVPTLGAR